MNDNNLPVVIDNGTNTIKAGFAGDENPRNEFPTVVGRWRQNVKEIFESNPLSEKQYLIGHEAIKYKGMLHVKHPVEWQLITNWDDMEKVWNHTFHEELKIDPEEHPVMMTETPMNPKYNREKMTQLMFETFHVPLFYTANSAVSALQATEKTTGIVVDYGHSGVHVVPVYEGYTLPNAVMKPAIHEFNLEHYLLKVLPIADRSFIKDIKEKHCYIALDYNKELEKFELSPLEIEKRIEAFGDTFTLGKEQFTCPEIIFQPNIVGIEMWGIHEYIYYTILKCDPDIRKALCRNIVLSGGTSLFPGFGERLLKELKLLFKDEYILSVKELENRRTLTFKGAAKMAAASSFHTMCISSEEYDEYGPTMVHRKCF